MSTDKDFHVGEKMDELLKKSDLTTEELATLMSISRGTWNNIRKAESPKLEHVQAFCNVLKIDFKEIFGELYADELDKSDRVAEAQSPYINSKIKDLSEELHKVYRDLSTAHKKQIQLMERELELIKLLASNNIPLPK